MCSPGGLRYCVGGDNRIQSFPGLATHPGRSPRRPGAWRLMRERPDREHRRPAASRASADAAAEHRGGAQGELPQLRDVGHHQPGPARRPRRAEAVAAADPGGDARPRPDARAARTSKCAGIVGETMKRYHPHGDNSIYPTLVRMAQWWNMRHLLITGQGNFGSIHGLPPAAMRYTEAKLSPVAAEMLEDIKLDTVDFQPNYDEKHQEPRVLPGKFPNLLVNGSGGIAVGMATEHPAAQPGRGLRRRRSR